MLYERTIKTLEKAGFVVTRDIQPSRMNPGTTYESGFKASLPNGLRYIEALKNGGDSDQIATMRVVRNNDKDDTQSDYFAGTWVDTVKRAISLATPTPQDAEDERRRKEAIEDAAHNAPVQVAEEPTGFESYTGDELREFARGFETSLRYERTLVDGTDTRAQLAQANVREFARTIAKIEQTLAQRRREANDRAGKLFVGHLLLGNLRRPSRPRI